MGQKPAIFSIIIPTYDRPRQLASCLYSLARLDYPRDRFEVIVVEDGSRIPLESVTAPLRDRINVKVFAQRHAGPATARNTGAAQARGEFLAFTDDDCEPAPDWLKKMAVHFSTSPDCVIGGRTLNALPHNPYSTASQILIDYLYAYYNQDPNQACFFTTNNLALPKKSFHEIGGFDVTYLRASAEDREFCKRWLHHGHRMTYAPEALVYHAHELTFRSFWRQHFNYGHGAFYFHEIGSRRGQESIKLEPLSFYLNLLNHPFSGRQGHRALLLTVLLLVSQAAHTAGFFWQKMKTRVRCLAS